MAGFGPVALACNVSLVGVSARAVLLREKTRDLPLLRLPPRYRRYYVRMTGSEQRARVENSGMFVGMPACDWP
jgi:hypothetical protein